MKSLEFKYRRIPSEIFGSIYRPYITVMLQKKDKSGWRKARMIVDTGADYSILPRSYAVYLGIDLTADCIAQSTHGVGGMETVYIYKGLVLKVGDFERKVPVGFLDRDDIPALFGRHECLETFRTVLDKRSLELLAKK